MKRKLFTFLVAFLATLSGAVWGQETTINLSSPQSGTGEGASIDEVTKTITIDRVGNYVITGSTTEYQVLIGSTSGTGTVNVTLSDATIELSDRYDYPIRIIERNTLNVILNIEGENLVSANNKNAGITVHNGSSLTIKGTGILRAKGWCGIGNAGGACGNISIESGTVVARGSAWCIGGEKTATTGSEPTLAMTGDALLVVYDDANNRDRGIFNIEYWGSDVEDPSTTHPAHGIYCNAKAQSGAEQLVGSLYDNVKLKSPFPSDDFVVDLNGNTLTLSKGSYARKNQITDTKGTGTLNAYEVVCTVPQIPNATMSTAPASMYYGPSTDLVAGDATATTNNGQTAYDFLGWVNNSGDFMDATDAKTPVGTEQVNVTAAFLLTKYALDIVKGTTLSESFNLVYPKNANVAVEDTNSELDKYGAKLDDTKKEVVAGDAVATADETSTPDKVTLKATYKTSETKDIELSMTVTDNAVDISTGTLELTGNNNTKVYDGKAVESNKLTWEISIGSETITPGGGLEVKFKKDKNDVDYMTENPTDVGTYYVYVVATSGTTYTGATTNEVTYTITKKTLNVEPEDVKWEKSASSTSPDFKNKLTLSGIIGSDDVSVTYDDPTGNWNIPGTYNVTYTNLALDGTGKDNYTLNSNTANGKLIVTMDGGQIDSGDPDNENTDIKPGGVDDWAWIADKNRYERTYDGKAHPLTKISIRVQNGDNTEWKELSADDFEVTYDPDTDVKDAGAYEATVTINDAESYTNTTATINLYINPADLTINLNVPATIEKGQNVSAWWTPEMAKFTGVKNEEPAKIEGSLSISDFEKANVGGTVKAIITGLKLVENTVESKTFKPSNYNPTWKNGDASITVTEGDAEIDDITVVDPQPNYPEEIKPGDEGWKWDGDSKVFTRVYDGQAHEIQSLIVDGETLTVGKDYTVVYNPSVVKNAGSYTAVITFTNPDKYQVISMPLKITEREMKVTFNVPNHIESTDPITITDEYVNYEAPSGNRGLVTKEAPKIESGKFVFEESSIEGKYKVILHDFVLSSSNTFNPDNYILQIWNATQGQYVEYNNTGDDITIIDPEKPEGNPNTPGEGVVVGPDDEGQQPSKNFCNIYVVEESSPYIQFHPSRNVVEAVGQITVDVVIPDEIEMDDVKLVFRRGNGEWETLTIDEETQKYTIKDINTHIYLKAEVDAALLDAEPNENHVYIDLSCTEDGIKLDAEREIVENGEDVLIWAEISKENLNKAIKYEYKVTRFGEWKELKATENAGEFIIWNVTNDVFVRAYLADQTKDPETTEEAAHHVYSDLSVTCKGLYLDADRKMVTDNGTTKVYLTIEPNYNAKNAHYMFRRGIHEAWEELTPSTEANVFVITGIESDIYLKATDAISTGMEDIDGTARIYTKDGSLYIYTPQQDDITVVSMTGAVVKRTKQIGLQSYPLNQGIYVVRVGEQVFKVRVK